MSDTSRPRASLRTAVVWEVLKEALDRRVKATGRDVLDVLDTGGGTGKFAVPVARLGHRVTVVDPSPNALFGLERRVAEAGVADLVRGVQGDAQGLLDVVERDAYDVVLCHGVLEYVDDPAEGVANTVAALRVDGTLSLLAAGLGGAVLARALAGHFTEARTALTDPAGRWGSGDPVPRRFTAEQLSELVGGAASRSARCTACGSSPTSCPGSWWTPSPAPWRRCCVWRRPPPSCPPSTRSPPSCTSWARSEPELRPSAGGVGHTPSVPPVGPV